MITEIIIAFIGASGIVTYFLKYRIVLKVIKETAELLAVSAEALEDGSLTKEEIENILKEVRDLVSIVRK